MQNIEATIKNAIGLGTPQLEYEPPKPQPEPTIYDFGKLLKENEPAQSQSADFQ